MTREETIKILGMLKIAYPKYYQNTTKEEAEQTVKLWASMLSEINVNLAIEGVKNIIKMSKWHPSIAEVIDSAKKVQINNYFRHLNDIKNKKIENSVMLNDLHNGLIKLNV